MLPFQVVPNYVELEASCCDYYEQLSHRYLHQSFTYLLRLSEDIRVGGCFIFLGFYEVV